MVEQQEPEVVILNSNIYSVEEFAITFEQPLNLSPEIIPDDRAQLRQALLEEEVSELREAIEKRSLPDILDALCDIEYIVSGTILEYGLHNIFDASFAEVHESNLRKVFENPDEVDEAIAMYKERGVDVEVKTLVTEEGQEVFYLKRLPDGKILKPKGWKAPDLAYILERFKEAEDEQTRIEAQA